MKNTTKTLSLLAMSVAFTAYSATNGEPIERAEGQNTVHTEHIAPQAEDIFERIQMKGVRKTPEAQEFLKDIAKEISKIIQNDAFSALSENDCQ